MMTHKLLYLKRGLSGFTITLCELFREVLSLLLPRLYTVIWLARLTVHEINYYTIGNGYMESMDLLPDPSTTTGLSTAAYKCKKCRYMRTHFSIQSNHYESVYFQGTFY